MDASVSDWSVGQNIIAVEERSNKSGGAVEVTGAAYAKSCLIDSPVEVIAGIIGSP